MGHDHEPAATAVLVKPYCTVIQTGVAAISDHDHDPHQYYDHEARHHHRHCDLTKKKLAGKTRSVSCDKKGMC